MSLSAVATRSSVSSRRVATNINAGGTTNLKNSLQNTYEANKVKYNKQLQENNALFKGISNQAKELGIAVTELPIYKEYVNASNILNELNKSNQTNWELISKY